MDDKGFGGLNISHHVLKDLDFHGLSSPMPIQEQAIPVLLSGKDLIAEAKTGTGKTLAFAIPVVEKINLERKGVQTLVLAPTRELAEQVSGEMSKVSYNKKVRIAAFYGGKSISAQANVLSRGVQVVVGTPGRILDLIERRMLRLDGVHTLVLDEADRMLDMGFIDDIRRIISHVPSERQTMLFSATMPESIRGLAQSIMKDPQVITIKSEQLTVDTVDQVYYEVSRDDKLDIFAGVLKMENPASAIIFCNTKRWADTLIRLMKHRGFHGEALHGDLSQNQRDRVMEGFRRKKFMFLVATDVAARGLDIDDVSHIFNYDLPKDRENYIHRIGRTARAGKSGKAISFVTHGEIRDLWDIEHVCRTTIKQANLEEVRPYMIEAGFSPHAGRAHTGDGVRHEPSHAPVHHTARGFAFDSSTAGGHHHGGGYGDYSGGRSQGHQGGGFRQGSSSRSGGRRGGGRGQGRSQRPQKHR